MSTTYPPVADWAGARDPCQLNTAWTWSQQQGLGSTYYT